MKAKVFIAVTSLVFVTLVAAAQPKEIGRFFPAAAVSGTPNYANVQYLVSGYVSPIAEDFGSLINSAWYNTAANHKKFGFDLSISISTVFINSSSKFFNVDNTKLTGVGYTGSTTGTPMATAYGPGTEIPAFSINSGLNSGYAFTGPGGGNLTADMPIGSLAIPTIQGGLGLFKNTDIRFRFTPAVKILDTETQNWGVGILHDIKQHIPGIKEVPFSLSVLVAYSSLTATTKLSGLYETAAGSGSYAGQEGLGETSAWTAQVLISKSIPVLTFYGGIGYNSSTTTYSIKGNYHVDVAYNASGLNPPLLASVDLTDPFKQDYTSSGFRATGGIRLKFGPIFLNSDYTFFRGIGLFTTGFGVTVR